MTEHYVYIDIRKSLSTPKMKYDVHEYRNWGLIREYDETIILMIRNSYVVGI